MIAGKGQACSISATNPFGSFVFPVLRLSIGGESPKRVFQNEGHGGRSKDVDWLEKHNPAFRQTRAFLPS